MIKKMRNMKLRKSVILSRYGSLKEICDLIKDHNKIIRILETKLHHLGHDPEDEELLMNTRVDALRLEYVASQLSELSGIKVEADPTRLTLSELVWYLRNLDAPRV